MTAVNDIWRRTHCLDREITRQTDESSATAAEAILPLGILRSRRIPAWRL